jgi:hypothetical protein
MSSVCSQGQIDSVCFNPSQAFNKAPRTILLDKVRNLGLSSLQLIGFKVNYHLDLPSFAS